MILDAGLYSHLKKQILSDQTTYVRLCSDPTDLFKEDLVEEGCKLGVFTNKE